jgi:hypothetical protein
MLMVAWLAAISLSMGPNAHGDTSASNRPFLSAQVMDQIAALGREKESWTPTQRKIGSKLLLASKRQLQRPMVAGVPATRFSPDTDAAGRVLVDIKSVVSDRLLMRIQSLGGLVINHSSRYSAIRAALPMAQLEVLAAESEVISIRPADKAFIQKVDTSEGVVAHRADTARTTFGVTGAG